MGRRSTVYALPPEVRDQLNARLVSQGFGGYSELAEWLSAQGYELSRSAVHRYGAELEAEYEAAMGDVRRASELARAYADADPDDAAALTGAVNRMAQEQLLRALLGLRKAEAAGEHAPGDMAKHLSTVSRALADLGRLDIQRTKHAIQVRRELAAEAADRAEAAAKKGGVSADGIAALRAAIMDGL